MNMVQYGGNKIIFNVGLLTPCHESGPAVIKLFHAQLNCTLNVLCS